MTGYDAGMRSKRITIARRTETTGGQFSQRSAGQKMRSSERIGLARTITEV